MPPVWVYPVAVVGGLLLWSAAMCASRDIAARQAAEVNKEHQR